MPDQSSAAQEHALLEQITGPLASLPENPVAITADVDFPVALRGYDRIAVDAYVARTSQLIAELHATASPEGAIRRALERVGEEVSGVLQQAHRTADEVTSQSRARPRTASRPPGGRPIRSRRRRTSGCTRSTRTPTGSGPSAIESSATRATLRGS